MAIFGYGWVDKREQSAETQRLEIESAGYEVEHWFTDVGISGKAHTNQRPQFVVLLNTIRDGETLVVTKLDCLGRDAEDVLRTVRRLGDRRIGVVVLQLGKFNLNSSTGKPMLEMLAAVAGMTRDVRIERTRLGQARAKTEGKALGRPSKTTLAQREEIRERYAAGESVSELARYFGISRSTVLSVVHLS